MKRSLVAVGIVFCLLWTGWPGKQTVRSVGGIQVMPPHPSLAERLRREGRPLPDMTFRYQRGVDVPQRVLAPPKGNFNLLAVAIQFSDKPGIVTPAFFDNLVFAAPSAGVNSVADYYDEVSGSTLTLVTLNLPSSLGWMSGLPRPYNGPTGYINADGINGTNDDWGFGNFPQNLQGIVWDLLPLLDTLVNFGQYDNDSNGFVDGLLIIHAGPGAEITGSANDIWSSSWEMTSNAGPGPWLTSEGVYVDNFAFVPEYMLSVSPTSSDQTIGVFCHELGHNLFGLPDLYDADNSSAGVGDWSLMGSGSWNGPGYNGASPAWPDAWSRMLMGFVTPMEVTINLTGFPVNPAEQGGQVFKLSSPYLTDGEYFLVESRQPVGYDAYLPGRGLLIWHIDEEKWNLWEGNRYECSLHPSCAGACPAWHYLVSLEQADGQRHLELNSNNGDAGDPFPGSNSNANFSFGTNPESGSWQPATCPTDSCIAVKNITVSMPGPPDLIFADFQVACSGAAASCINILPPEIGWGHPGGQHSHLISLQNCGPTDYFGLSYTGVWSAYFYDPLTNMPITGLMVQPGGTAQLGLRVSIPESAGPGMANVGMVTLTPQWLPGPPVSTPIETRIPTCVLLVDDDAGNPNVELRYIMALTNGNFAFDYWNVALQGSPTSQALAAHRSVIWFTGSAQVDTLRPRQEMALANYLDSGGQLFLSSQDYLWDVARTTFNRLYLRLRAYIDNWGANGVRGVAGNPVGQGMGPFTFIQPQPRADMATALTPATVAFQNELGIDNALTLDNSTWRTLFLAWPFEALTPADADVVMASAMNWFDVLPRPVVSFTVSTSLACVGEVVTFTNTTSGADDFWWDFGDGWTSTMTDTTHAYQWPITATVSLRGANCCGFNMAYRQVTAIYAPQAAFTASDDVVLTGQSITFTSVLTNVTRIEWNFGDGITSTLHHPTHVYTLPMQSSVTLTAWNGCGSVQVSHPITVYAPVVAGFQVSNLSAQVGETLTFTNTSQNASAYLWDFGDGVGTSTQTHPIYAYANPGVYTVTLQASNPASADSHTAVIHVSETSNLQKIYLPVAIRSTVGRHDSPEHRINPPSKLRPSRRR